jgi:hypothetical protein
VDAAEDDNVRLRLHRLLAQLQRIAHEVGDILHLAALVVVDQDDGLSGFFQLQDALFYRFIKVDGHTILRECRICDYILHYCGLC